MHSKPVLEQVEWAQQLSSSSVRCSTWGKGACISRQVSFDKRNTQPCVMQQESPSMACSSVEEALHRARQLLAMLPSSNNAPALKVALNHRF